MRQGFSLFCLFELALAITGPFNFTARAYRPFSRELDVPGQEDTQYYTVSWFPRPWSTQFQFKEGTLFHLLSTTTCNESLQDYHTALNSPWGSFGSLQLLAVCYNHEDCIFDRIPTDLQLNLQSAGVILGLLPTLMSTLGINIAEIALLSAHRPLLSLLLSLAAPAAAPFRPLEYYNPEKLLESEPGRPKIRKFRRLTAYILSSFEYLLIVAAVVSNFLLMWDIGKKAILSWGCTTTFGPLLWVSLSFIIHVPSALSYGIVVWRARRRQHKKGMSRSLWDRFFSVLKSEFTICANIGAKTGEKTLSAEKLPVLAVVLQIIAGFGSFIHLVLGTIVFSSLLFLTVKDVLSNILWRLILSTLAARVILLIEIAGLRSYYGKHNVRREEKRRNTC